jgi:hypothetical protein
MSNAHHLEVDAQELQALGPLGKRDVDALLQPPPAALAQWRKVYVA